MRMVDNYSYRRNIACHPITDSIVIQAGPGSGKTTLLIERLKYIIENRNTSYTSIACITYTNAAKDEIIMRLQNKGVQLPAELVIGTIHSFLLEYVIKPYSYIASKDKKPFKLSSIGFARGYKREIGQMLNRPAHSINESILNAFESLGRDEEGKPYCFTNTISPEIAIEWKKLIKEKGYIDQQDVIYLSYLILNKYEHIRNALSSRFPYFLIDEYQDVTFFQDKLFSLLERSSFFCVGDCNQSIYSFTGARPELFLSKWQNQRFTSYTLSNNFRSSEHIVNFSNNKTDIVQIGTGPNKSCKQSVLFIKDINKASEVIQLFHRIREDIECEDEYKPYMILARKNDYVKELSFFLKEHDADINHFLNKLRKEHYRRYQILLNVLLTIIYKRRNELEKAVERMSEAFSYLFFNEHPNFVTIAEIEYDNFMWKKLQIFTLQFLDSLVLSEISVENLFIQLKNFLSEQSKKQFGKSIGRKILMLNYDWNNQVRASKNTMLLSLIEQVELQMYSSEKEGFIFNIHSAKGLESECVLVMAESESQLIDWLGENEKSEEARVGYVAFSRARKLLCVWAPNIQEENYKHLQQHLLFVDRSYNSKKLNLTI
jgi:DNA helicase II / ATP-dependent DNA helicase PcrA